MFRILLNQYVVLVYQSKIHTYDLINEFLIT